MSNDKLLPCPFCIPPVLDVCCGVKGMWFNKNDKRALYLDKRRESHFLSYPSGNYKEIIDPDVIGDFTDIKQPDNMFYLVVFDPPHIKREKPLGRITKKYGCLNGDWKAMLKNGFRECFRVLRPGGVLIFKWCEVEIPVKDILALTPNKPLFGHKSGKAMQTHWITFMKVSK